jgi:hypothetical protein
MERLGYMQREGAVIGQGTWYSKEGGHKVARRLMI